MAKPLCSLSYSKITLLESDHDVVGYPVSDLILKDIRTVELVSDWLIENLGMVIKNRVFYSICMQLQLCQIKEREKISIYMYLFTLTSQKSEKQVIPRSDWPSEA